MTTRPCTKTVNHYFLVGGAGYIGKTVYHTLKESETSVISVYDNLSTGNGHGLEARTSLVVGDVQNAVALAQALAVTPTATLAQDHADGFQSGPSPVVMMFAGSKSVAESVQNPYLYYQNNVGGLLSLVRVMKELGMYKLVFSSSATVYGQPQYLPVDEAHPLSALNPYGWSKYMCEQILRDLAKSDPKWRIGILRYFNPVGAWPERGHGETPQSPPPNVMPYIAQVAAGKREMLRIYGNDYDTVDGTGVRDYVHVRDLAEAHVRMAEYLDRCAINCTEVNVGTGRGYSVLQILREFERVSGTEIPYKVVERRAGDAGSVYCDTRKAKELLGWEATRNLHSMCLSEWVWQLCN